jgi:hypothetical protein
MEWRVVQLKGRAEVSRRTLRRLDCDAALAARRIENGANIPLRVHIHLYSALGTQHVVQTFVDSRGLRELLL